jgi:anti-sigma factor RsiW
MRYCAEILELLPWYVEGSLDGEEARAVALHLTECAECLQELALTLRVRTELADGFERMPKASEGLWDRIRTTTQGRSVARLDVGSFLLGFTMGASIQRRSLPIRGDLRLLGRKIRLFDVGKGGNR